MMCYERKFDLRAKYLFKNCAVSQKAKLKKKKRSYFSKTFKALFSPDKPFFGFFGRIFRRISFDLQVNQ